MKTKFHRKAENFFLSVGFCGGFLFGLLAGFSCFVVLLCFGFWFVCFCEQALM